MRLISKLLRKLIKVLNKLLHNLEAVSIPPENAQPVVCDGCFSDESLNRWEKPFEVLREKWVEIPTRHATTNKSTGLLSLSDDELLQEWQKSREDITTGKNFCHRGWYHALYSDCMAGKKVLDIGSGFAIDSITFAQKGAKVTFVDIVESNLGVVQRLCKIFGLNEADFVLLKNLESLTNLDHDFDVIMAMGSLHHAPQSVIKPEAVELMKHLRIGGRWLQLAYPKTRWERYGRPSFEKFGEMTDGPGTPWAEWYDLPKLLDLLKPGRFQTVLCQEFNNNDFIWFDLFYQGIDEKEMFL